jgi:hypothetical protein
MRMGLLCALHGSKVRLSQSALSKVSGLGRGVNWPADVAPEPLSQIEPAPCRRRLAACDRQRARYGNSLGRTILDAAREDACGEFQAPSLGFLRAIGRVEGTRDGDRTLRVGNGPRPDREPVSIGRLEAEIVKRR